MAELAHLRRWWSSSGRKGFGFGGIRRFLGKWNAYFLLHRKSEKKRRRTAVTVVTGRCTGRGRGLTGRVRSVLQLPGTRELGFATGASGPSRNRSVQLGTQRSRAGRRADQTRGTSGHMRSDASGRCGSLLDSDRTPGAVRLVIATVTSDAHCSCLSCSD
jgi:hypothetical protein